MIVNKVIVSCFRFSTALDLHLALGILRLQQGLDLKENTNVDQNGKTASNESLTPKNMSYSQMSQSGSFLPEILLLVSDCSVFSGSSCSDISAPATPIARTKDFISTNPNPDEQPVTKLKSKIPSDTLLDSLLEEASMKDAFPFQKKQKRGATIDVWWLYDDGGNFENLFLFI